LRESVIRGSESKQGRTREPDEILVVAADAKTEEVTEANPWGS
jgi:hypothetical protein